MTSTSGPTFTAFFAAALGDRVARPYEYQTALAGREWPDVLVAPTGTGKTAAVVLGWMWRHFDGDRNPPRRLVYCLPMRTLVDQTARNTREWCRRLRQAYPEQACRIPDPKLGVHVLRGGTDTDRAVPGLPPWVRQPESRAVLIGTQDMLLSRALMRGYAMSRFRWPVDFALLHNDAQWVFDEVQLMSSGLATSTQLEGFRRKWLTGTPSGSLWLSATLHPDWLRTVDFRRKSVVWRVPGDFPADQASAAVRRVLHAPKPIRRSDGAPAGTGIRARTQYAEWLARTARERHRGGRTTLVIVNRVDRAQAVFRALKAAGSGCELALVHSRFRPGDRDRQMKKLPRPRESKDVIVIATQAIEAGVDLSASVLITEAAPFPSLVQRFGRVNRYGELNGSGGGVIQWVGPPGKSVSRRDRRVRALPYSPEDIEVAMDRLERLSDARPSALPEPAAGDFSTYAVIRAKDLLDLYDTDPDLTGFDVDVSRFIRDEADTDVHVFCRDFDPATAVSEPLPRASEMCSVPIGAARSWLGGKSGKSPIAYRLDPQARRGKAGTVVPWIRLDGEPWPGLTLMLRSEEGGYDPEVGFDPGSREPVPAAGPESPPCDPTAASQEDETLDSDPDSRQERFVSLTSHLEHAHHEAVELAGALDLPADLTAAVAMAARWHDLGKAHEAFQDRLTTDDPARHPRPVGLLAKSRRYDMQRGRPWFRHELASALGFLAARDWRRSADLVAFLILAHHGKVRMNLRAFPRETPPRKKTGARIRFARGVWEGDELPPLALGGRDRWGGGRLHLSVMEIGEDPQTGASWAERARTLLDHFGPFRLAWLEALVRIADWRASAKEQRGDYD